MERSKDLDVKYQMMDPRKLQRLLRQMKMELQNLDAEQVIIRTQDYDLVFENPQVTITSFAGTNAYQILGNPKQIPRQKPIPMEDIKLVMEKAGVDESTAKQALIQSGGDIAAAILSLKGGSG